MKFVNADNLACPLCTGPLAHIDSRLVCSGNHSFDLARQGYVNLLPVQHKKSRAPGDSKAMVAARRAFLNQGYYEPVARELVKQVRCHRSVAASSHYRILDAGCGEGYYLNYLVQALLNSGPDLESESESESEREPAGACETTLSAIGLDISKDAIIAATQRNKMLRWVVGTNVHPPVAVGSVDCLLCLFGFPGLEHFKTLLREGGILILADPGPDHLIELRERIYPEVKRSPATKREAIGIQGLQFAQTSTLSYRTDDLEQAQIQSLLAMTPHLYRASHEGKRALVTVEKMKVTVEVVFQVFVKRTTVKD